MAKDRRKRLQNKLLKRSGVGMKWQRKFENQQEWSKAVNNISGK